MTKEDFDHIFQVVASIHYSPSTQGLSCKKQLFSKCPTKFCTENREALARIEKDVQK